MENNKQHTKNNSVFYEVASIKAQNTTEYVIIKNKGGKSFSVIRNEKKYYSTREEAFDVIKKLI